MPPNGAGRRIARIWTWLRRSLAALGLLMIVVTFTPLVEWWALALARPWVDTPGDVMIVLGGSSIGGGILGDSSYRRAVYAVKFHRESAFRRIIVSGGPASDPVAAAMSGFLTAHGIPASVITLETESRTTRENALAAAKLLSAEGGRKILVTSDFHMFRAHRTFAKAGIETTGRPLPDALKREKSRLARWSVFLDLATETAKIGYYLARGWI